MALTDKLSAIGAAIREKTGKSELLTLDAMPIEILAITTGEGGGGVDIPEEAFLITSSKGAYAFYNGFWDWFLEKYGDKITTDALVNPIYMFAFSEVERIPFNLYIASGEVSNCFYQCFSLKEIPDIYIAANDGGATGFGNMFQGCVSLREAPNITNVASASKNSKVKMSSVFASCYSLRKLPSWVTNLYDNQDTNSTAVSSNTYSFYSASLQDCYSLDEAVDLPVFPGSMTSNRMTNFIVGCRRLSRLTFKKALGSPIIAKWKRQTLDFTQGYTGYGQYAKDFTRYNSGITADKEVKDDATYQALKNDPDWFSCKKEYSRYNHDSAVETIYSLPDTTTGGGANTIKFYADAGSATDGGAIGNLTEAEIAVATAKGWTVTLL